MTRRRTMVAAAMLAGAAIAGPAWAAPSDTDATPAEGSAGIHVAPKGDGIPDQLDATQRAGYRTVFQAIRESRWTDAQLALDGMKPGPLHAIARAELYTSHGSPKVEAAPIVEVLTQSPELPEADALARLARAKGASDLPELPVAQRMTWIDGSPSRARAKSIKSDLIAADLAQKMQPYVKDDQGAAAQALLDATDGLSPDAQTEWQQKVGWIYYLQGDDANARVMAAKASAGSGDWAIQGEWIGALAAWRQDDCTAAGKAFEDVAARASDTELRAAGLFWAARADMACGRPDRIEARLKNASQFKETFYGLLARQSLGIQDPRAKAGDRFVLADWVALERRPNIRVAAALTEIGEATLADQVLRHQAAIGDPNDFAPLVRLAAKLDLPATVIWLSHNGPVGITPTVAARYPAPNWTPDGGWRVDKALVYAHTLQESRFRTDVVSHAGAYGLMQIMPSVAKDYARAHGTLPDRAALRLPSTNMELGQMQLERLRDQQATGGLLPKVIAAYNAGPVPVQLWNALSRDGGDPLLYIESIPYWETRGYVMTVLRNYWMYEGQLGTSAGKGASPSRVALAQGMWPRFPGLAGPSAIRMNARPLRTATASVVATSASVPVSLASPARTFATAD
ncbi:lytic transglycosylase domain-containing protein [uncultured Sphingomonas sp.]|uniref:lytic transglycosylase domain-containing protein n=1 Tax=uncultured Sphingomonas sp. TaxID=158754 RepID=UPI0035CB9B0F